MTGSVLSLTDAATFARAARQKGKTIVTTNGTFDLFHTGHRFLLEEARRHGDILIVGINSDASVRRYKGEGRPIEKELLRARKVAEHADAVFLFDDDDPRPWLRVILPDVHVNAETYGEDCIEAETLRQIGAKLVLVPIRPELGSTSEMLDGRSKKKR